MARGVLYSIFGCSCMHLLLRGKQDWELSVKEGTLELTKCMSSAVPAAQYQLNQSALPVIEEKATDSMVTVTDSMVTIALVDY